MTLNYINVVRIDKVFAEFNSKAIERLTLEDVLAGIKEPNQSDSLYEYFTSDRASRFFMDIENIKSKSLDLGDRIIEQIILDFLNFMNVFNVHFSKVAVTKNFNSANHEGQSFHVIFDGVYVRDFAELKFWMSAFLALYPSNRKYIDPIVYKVNRMFKLPNQYGVNKEGVHIRENSTNIHVPYCIYTYEHDPNKFYSSIYHSKQEKNISEENLKYFIVQVKRRDLTKNDYAPDYPFSYGEALKIKLVNISQEGSICKKNVEVKNTEQLESDIIFKCLKFKIMTSRDERMKFVDDVMKFRKEHQTVDSLNGLSKEQIDQLLDIVLNNI